MQSFLSSLLASLLLAHSALGCCWHHVEDCLAGEPGHSAHLCGCCHDPDVDPGDERHHEHDPCDCHLNCEGKYPSLPPRKIALDPPTVIFDLVAATSDSFGEESRPVRASVDFPTVRYGPPLRLHLLNQSLLI